MIAPNPSHGRRTAPATGETLLDGVYPAGDARDVVLPILDATINFHKLRNLRSHVHTEQPDRGEVDSIEDLRLARRELADLLAGKQAEGRRVRIRAAFDIEIVEDPARH